MLPSKDEVPRVGYFKHRGTLGVGCPTFTLFGPGASPARLEWTGGSLSTMPGRRNSSTHVATTPRSNVKDDPGRSRSFVDAEDRLPCPFDRLPVHDSLPLVWAHRTGLLAPVQRRRAPIHTARPRMLRSQPGYRYLTAQWDSDAIRRPDRPRGTSPVRAARPFGTIARSARSRRVRRPSHPGGRSRRSDSRSPHRRVSSPRRRSR